jgi:hypothetical protein
MSWLAGYLFRKQITIAHTDDGAQTNYQLKLLVGESSGATGGDIDCNSHVLPSFNDLRFTASDGDALCDYWIESFSGTTPNQLATIWIEVPSIAAHPNDTIIYMYYGKVDEPAVSNGDNTFPFFDHFDVDLSKWGTQDGTPTIAASILTTNTANEYVKSTYTGTYKALRFLANFPNSGAGAFHVVGWNNNAAIPNPNPAAMIYEYGAIQHGYTSDANSADDQTFPSSLYSAYYWFDILWCPSFVKYYANSVLKVTCADVNDIYASALPIFIGNPISGSDPLLVDVIFARNFTLNEPAWGVFGDEGVAATSKAPWTDIRNSGPWTFEKQQNKYGYRNNPRWVDVAGVGAGLLSPVWPMDDKVMSAGISKKHNPCGYWYSGPGGSSGTGAKIGFTTQQMPVNGVQTLVPPSGDYPCFPWVWTIISGGGSITQDGVYTAPANNALCVNNVTIGLSCQGVIVDTLQIGINVYTGNEQAYREFTCINERHCYGGIGEPGCNPAATSCGICAKILLRSLRCDGVELGSSFIGGTVMSYYGITPPCWNLVYGCSGDIEFTLNQSSCEAIAVANGGHIGIVDDRTQAMINAGCCPVQLF